MQLFAVMIDLAVILICVFIHFISH